MRRLARRTGHHPRRLTLDEHDQRLAAAWAAGTRTELDAVFADLPGLPEPRRSVSGPAVAAAVVALLAVFSVVTVWVTALAHPVWAAGMMAACM
jgi:uncharacterized protein DUF1707